LKTLGLFRHAKSGWDDPRARDFDRTLNERGRRGAVAMGKHIREAGYGCSRILASPAVRCAQTIELGSEAAGQTYPVIWDRRIYLASSATLLDLLREQEGDPPSILMIGHNPGLEDLIFDLVPDDGSCPLRDVVEEKFPTAAYAVLELDVDKWADAAPGCARLVHLTRPRDIDASLGPELAA
jgi:phosphohistidine phosphatase